MRRYGLKREAQRVTKGKGLEAVIATGIWSQESENQGGESKNSRSRVNRVGLEQVLLWLALVGQLGTVGVWVC